MKYPGYIVLDIETTGFDPAVDDAIEFAAVRLDGTGKVTAELDLVLGTDKPVSPLVVSLTGIQPSTLIGQPTLDDVKAQIEEFVGDLPIVGHNIGFDVDFLTAKGLNLPGDRLDTLELAQTVLPAQPGYGLEQLSYSFNFPHQPSHRAMNDVMATVDLMLMLIGVVGSQTQAVQKNINELVKDADWSWAWLWQFDLNNFVIPQTKLADHAYTDFLLSEITKAQKQEKIIIQDAASHINLLETHLPIDSLAIATVYAAHSKPSILIVPGALMRPVDWVAIGKALKTPFVTMSPVDFQYQVGLPSHVLASALESSATLVRLCIKLTLWETAWKHQPEALYLSSEEQYEWEQKFVDSTAEQNFKLGTNGVWVVTPELLSRISNVSDFELVCAHPHNLEESFFDTQTRTFSVPYLNASISSRRDFIHREVIGSHPKVADELFKLLSIIGTRFTKLSELLIQIYLDHPPTSVYEHDIELIRPYCPAEFETVLGDIVNHFETYQQKLSEIGFEPTNHQVARTARLIEHLKALRDFNTGYKYFLSGEANKFYLQIIPSLDIFSAIQTIFSASKRVTVISAGLVFGGSFAYWKYLFGDGAGKLISDKTPSSTIQLVSDVDSEDNYQDVLRTVEATLASHKKMLLVAGSAYDARTLFDELYKEFPNSTRQIRSLDTVGLTDKLTIDLPDNEASIVVVPLYWLEKGSAALPSFNQVIISKIAFEATNKPIAKLYRGDRGSFAAYTLPKTTLKLKEHLHHLLGFAGPIVLLDPRLTHKDYGTDILNALAGWQIIDQPLSEVLKTL